MSFLVVEVLSKGIVFGADKNVTTTLLNGTQHQLEKTEKVLIWPNNRAIIGYVGQGQMGNLSTATWMTNFINRNLNYKSLEAVSKILTTEVEAQMLIDEKGKATSPFIIHVGGFDFEDAIWVPKIYMVTNVYALENGKYTDFRKQFKFSEELWKYFPNSTKDTIKRDLEAREIVLEPHWFHQGFDLITFNVLHVGIKYSFKYLVQHHPKHSLPDNLGEWKKHIKMQLLM